jgi:hypothetical protein
LHTVCSCSGIGYIGNGSGGAGNLVGLHPYYISSKKCWTGYAFIAGSLGSGIGCFGHTLQLLE